MSMFLVSTICIIEYEEIRSKTINYIGIFTEYLEECEEEHQHDGYHMEWIMS